MRAFLDEVEKQIVPSSVVGAKKQEGRTEDTSKEWRRGPGFEPAVGG